MKKHLRIMKFITSVLIVYGTSSATAAVWCGMSVTVDVVLDSDLYCASGLVDFALRVETDNITIDLNGFRIYGDNAGLGIEVKGANGFKLVGNGGSVSNFDYAVDLNDSSESVIEGVMFYKNKQAAITNRSIAKKSTGNQYISNVFIYGEYGINLDNIGGFAMTQQRIDDNQFYKVGINIRLHHSSKSEVTNNFIWNNQRVGIVLFESDYNYIEGNQILDSVSNAIEVSNASFNEVISNTFDGGRFGMYLVSVEGDGGCTSSDVSEFNDIRYNYFLNFERNGVYLRPFSCGEVRFNSVNSNKIYDDEVGIYLSREVQNNNLTANGFYGTVRPIFDLSDGSNAY